LRDVDGWDLAAQNAEDECVISGEAVALSEINAALRAEGTGTMPVPVTHAFHSRQLDPVLTEFAEAVECVPRSAPSRPYISCVTGTWVTADQAVSVNHWVQHLRGTVQFASGIRTALAAGTTAFVQLGPGFMATSNIRRSRAQAVVIVGDDQSPRSGVAEAWARGAKVRWQTEGRRIALPGYPFQRRDYAFDPAAAVGTPEGRSTVGEALMRPTPPTPTDRETRRYPRPPLTTAYRPASDDLERKIVALVEDLLSTSGIGVDDDYFELGWDSLLAMSLASRLSDDLGFEVDADLVYDEPSAARLARALAELDADEDGGRRSG
jgi:acyl transferase domain-containing protein